MKSVIKYTLSLILLGIALRCYAGIWLKRPVFNKPGKALIQVRAIDCPTISTADAIVTPATCNNKNGSITGVKVISTGTKIQYNWLDTDNNSVGHNLDLLNVGPGTYMLEVIDNSGCTAAVLSPPVKLDAIGAISISGNPVIVPSSCSSEGSISGLIVTGATRYVWNCFETGLIYQSTTTPDLFNLPPGTYKLLATNTNCNLQSVTYNVASKIDIPEITKVEIDQPTCNNTGADAIRIYLSRHVNSPATGYIFYDDANAPIYKSLLPAGKPSLTVMISNQPPGTYKFAVSNLDYSCPVILGTYTLVPSQLVIHPDLSEIGNDKCNQHNGYIIPYLTGMTPPKPLSTFSWTNVATGQVLSHAKSLFRVGAGTYHLDATDAFGCPATADFVITNTSPTITPPQLAGSSICLPGNIVLTVSNRDTGTVYKLYKSLTDSVAVASNRQGAFTQHIDKTTDFFVAAKHGDCESERTKVTATVVADIKIPNAITPNNDGINDNWNIAGIEKFQGAEIRIFTRSGHQIFYSLNNTVIFNGSYKGLPLPVGVYYYTIDLKQPVCFGKIAGAVTLIR